jgi:hypothetical protein
LTRLARAGLELTTYRLLSESTTTRLRQPVDGLKVAINEVQDILNRIHHYYECGIGKFHRGDKIRILGQRSLSQRWNFLYPKRVNNDGLFFSHFAHKFRSFEKIKNYQNPHLTFNAKTN